MIGASRAVVLGSGGAGGYRFYRLSITATNLDARCRIGELQLVTPSNPTGVPSGGTPTAISTLSGNSPEMAFDGDLVTYWGSAASPALPVWLQYEFPSHVTLVSYRIGMPAFPNFLSAYAPRSFNLHGSNDGETWDTLDTQSELTWSTGEMKEFPL